MKRLGKITQLLLLTAVGGLSSNSHATVCIGNDFGAFSYNDTSIKPFVKIENKATLQVVAGGELTLSASALVDKESGGIPFFYWCAENGSLQPLPNTPDYSSVKFVTPSTGYKTVAIEVNLGDSLGRVAREKVFITLSPSVLMYKIGDTVYIDSASQNINFGSSGTISVDGKSVDASWSNSNITFDLPLANINKSILITLLGESGEELYSSYYPFSDVFPNRWYTRPVMKLWQQQVVQGYGNGTTGIFGPFNNATRAEFIVAVVRAINNGTLPTASNAPFEDIAQDEWFAGAVEYAKNQGWISGCNTEKTRYCPHDPISNAEAMKILALAFERVNTHLAACESSTTLPFNDVDADAWFAPYVCAAKAARAAGGFYDGSFRPSLGMKRAFMAKAICIAAYGTSECIADGDELLPVVAAVSPNIATVGEAVTLSVEGFHLPQPVTMLLAGCDNLSPTGTATPEKQDFTCTPNSEGVLTGQITDSTDMVLFEFTLDVQADSATEPTDPEPPVDPVDPTDPTDPVEPPVEPTEPGGAADDPGNALSLFMINGQPTISCQFTDSAPTTEFETAVRILCSAGIVVGYVDENGNRVFVTPDNTDDIANTAEVLKVFLLTADYAYVSEHSIGSNPWYQFYMDDAVRRGLPSFGLQNDGKPTREQALTWLAMLFYNYTGGDPVGYLQGLGITNGSNPENTITRYEMALLAVRALIKTDKLDEIPIGLWDTPAPKTITAGGVRDTALNAIGAKSPYIDADHTYSHRFVRMIFDKPAMWKYPKDMCAYYAADLTANDSPPAGAVLCYAADEGNDNFGHVAIAVGDGSEVGASSLTEGVVQRDSVYGSAYQGWVSADTFNHQYPQ